MSDQEDGGLDDGLDGGRPDGHRDERRDERRDQHHVTHSTVRDSEVHGHVFQADRITVHMSAAPASEPGSGPGGEPGGEPGGGPGGEPGSGHPTGEAHFHVHGADTTARRGPSWPLVGCLLALALAAVLALVLTRGGLSWAPAARVGVAGFAVAASVAAWLELRAARARRRRAAVPPERLRAAAETLARTLGEQYEREEHALRLDDPLPIQVGWSEGDPRVVDQWVHVRDDAKRPLDLTGRFDDVAELFGRLPTGRLVVLGGPGAGKSALVLRLAGRLLADRAPDAAVPVLFPLASWDPRRQQGLWHWAAARIAAEHTDLGPSTAERQTIALELIRTGRILPVLDGFDELPRPAQPEALARLRASLGGPARFVLTSRITQYVAAVELGGAVLDGAAVVRIRPLSVAEVSAYLPRTTRLVRGDDGYATKWDPVLERLRDTSGDPPARRLRSVLSTPLMVAMARAAYSGTRADPAELLDPGRFPDRASVEEHLFDRFVPSVYAVPLEGPGHAGAAPGPDEAQVRRWAGWLAAHLRDSQSQELSWWRLDEAVPRPVRALGTAAAAAVAAVTVTALGVGELPYVHLRVGLAFALFAALAVVSDWVLVAPEGLPEPHRLPTGREYRQLLRERVARSVSPYRYGWLLLAAAGTAAALRWHWLTPWILSAVGAVVTGATVMGALHSARRPADPAAAADPPALVRADRGAAFVTGVLTALSGHDRQAAVRTVLKVPPLLLVCWAMSGGGGSVDLRDLVRTLAGTVLAAAVYGVAVSAWGRYTVARCWLAVTGKLPFRLMPFLQEAHRHGLLRRSGGSYRFRHIELRNRLAGPRPTPAARPAGRRRGLLGRVWAASRSAPAAAATAGLLFVVQIGTMNALGAPGPYLALPDACALLSAEVLKPVMTAPVVWQTAPDTCHAIDDAPFAPATRVSLTTHVEGPGRGDSALGKARTGYGGWLRTTRALAQPIDRQPYRRRGPDTEVSWAGAVVGNVYLRLYYEEEFGGDDRTPAAAEALLGEVRRRASLGPAPASGRPSLDALPARKPPAGSRFTAYHDVAPQAVAGATWSPADPSYLWAFEALPFVMRAPSAMDCFYEWRTGPEVVRFRCGYDRRGGSGSHFALVVELRWCATKCTRRDLAALAATPAWSGLGPWAWHDAWALRSEAATGPVYRLNLLRAFTNGGTDYFLGVRGTVSPGRAATLQKVVNDIYTQTGGRPPS
ncbi:NACHT domain-containing protein [Kitasatospora purpeofusca]|uniref:NACHT domain-containing protein n=1 Tax=Kitasatospora purpeofusca TaxID=67352 RepID=UPI002A5A434D|nr:NACHT domain-containing protein [Kitasatospora purpeofusca]MDY0813076.1 NACHT domain-containing protein [Kitasatospora purpeofusca]